MTVTKILNQNKIKKLTKKSSKSIEFLNGPMEEETIKNFIEKKTKEIRVGQTRSNRNSIQFKSLRLKFHAFLGYGKKENIGKIFHQTLL